MDDVDRLLAELEAKHNQKTKVRAPEDAVPSQADPDSPPVQSLDALLSQLEDDTKRAVRSQLSQHPPRSQHLWLSSPTVPDAIVLPKPSPVADPLLDTLKAEYAAKEQIEQQKQAQQRREAEIRQQQEAAEKQRRLEALRVKRRAELTEQAAEWLKTLKPRSEEGLWFEEFACNYDSRLEAALDYLEALQSVEREFRGV